MPIVEDMLNTTLDLPVKDRMVLAERLAASLDDLDEGQSDRLWGEEAERRLRAYGQSTARARPAEAVYARPERLPSDWLPLP